MVSSVAFLAWRLVASGSRERPGPIDLRRLALVGLFGVTTYHLALNAGAQTVSAGAASVIVNTAPLFTALLGHFTLGERLRSLGWAGCIVGFAGAGVVSLADRGGQHLGPGAALIFLAAISHACFFVLQKPLLARYSAADVTCYAIWFGTVALLPFAPAALQALDAAPPSATAAVVYLGLLPGALGNVTWAYVLAQLPVSRAAPLLYLVAPLAATIGWLALGEIFTPLAAVGAAIAMGGVALTRARERIPTPGGRR
jgi:drug/metabolite transporter (DMT)-like permease